MTPLPVLLMLLLLGIVGPVRAPAGPAHPAGTTSLRKCEEYGRMLQSEEAARRGVAAAEGQALCHLDLVVLAVVGGDDATLYEFPHMAAVGFGESDRKRWLCGGALISERYILTAAHCLEDKPKPGRRGMGPARWVRLGDLDLVSEFDNDRAQDFSVAQRTPHPGYKDEIKYNDIGLIRLDRDVVFSSAVRPACLHTLIDPVPGFASATGWGRLEEDGALSDRLQKISLPLVRHEDCRRHFDPANNSAYRHVLSDGVVGSMVCAGGEAAGGRDTCGGDSGGPLQVLRAAPRCLYSVLGVTSFGKGCARPGLPGVYTRVAEFVPWLESVVWPSHTTPSFG